MLEYILPLVAFSYGLLQLAKDWDKHQTTLRRATSLVLLMLLGIGSAINSHYSKKKVAEQQGAYEIQIAGLKTAVETSSRDQTTNTQQFVDGFGKLSDEVRKLQTEVTTEKLQVKLASVQAELQKTQKALGPGPKAELAFSFSPFTNPTDGSKLVPVTDKTLSVSTDGSVHVEYGILNLTETDAVDVEINFQICNGCKFAKEPEGLSKLAGLTDNQRYLYIHELMAKMSYKILSVDIVPPPLVEGFYVGIEYRCHTCVLKNQPTGGFVRLLRN